MFDESSTGMRKLQERQFPAVFINP